MSVPADRYDLPRNKFPACLESVLSSPLQSAAAGHLHPHNRYTLDVVVPDDRSQFFRIVYIIQLGATDDCNLTFHKFLMHIGISIGRTIRRDQQLCAFEKWSLCRYQLNLIWQGHWLRRETGWNPELGASV